MTYLAPLALLALAAPIAAGELGAARAPRKIVVDGVIGNDEWKGASPASEFTQFEPYRGELAQEKTETYVLYDDELVYFGFVCRDSEPSRIAAQLTRRDSDLSMDDSVMVVLDTFHDGRSAYFFATNLLGTQQDGRVTDNGRVVDDNWDATWYSAAASSKAASSV
jgi:hypothetical protein